LRVHRDFLATDAWESRYGGVDRFSARPGERIEVKVSSRPGAPYAADLVRMRSFAARHADDQRAMVLMAPGWIRTELGGPEATFSVEETIPQLVDTLAAQQGKPGLRFIDRHGETVP
jgi:hypothetical protein